MDNITTYVALRGFRLNGNDYLAGDPIPQEVINKTHNLSLLLKLRWIGTLQGITPIEPGKQEGDKEPGTGSEGGLAGAGGTGQQAGGGNAEDDETKKKEEADAAAEAKKKADADAETLKLAEAFKAAIAELKKLSVDKLKAALQGITDTATLQALLEGEERKTALEAINERIEALKNPEKGA
jgi:hypothetical protein